MSNNEKLNKKLAEWAGFVLYGDYTYFTSSLDACFRWLVPKLEYYFSFKFWQTLYKGEARRWVCQAHNKGWVADFGKVETYAETPALALCKAIEQLIDKEAEG